jgi:hypothetical protein
MKKILLILLIGSSVVRTSLAQNRDSVVVSIVSEKRDTLFLADTPLGCEILDIWLDYPNENPIIILKSRDWIIRENRKRNYND